MKDKDIFLLKRQDTGTSAKRQRESNRWGWPEQIPDKEKPEDRKNSRRPEIMDWIKSKIGLKKCLREWNRETLHGKHFGE